VTSLYLNLHSARERLCLAQLNAPAHWKSDLQAAINIVDQCGSSVAPDQWSKHNQPEYPEPKS
jgi:hypothetical protein